MCSIISRQNFAFMQLLDLFVTIHSHSLWSVPKHGPWKCRVVIDLSYPSNSSVNSGIPDSSYLNEPYKLRIPGINRLFEFILQLSKGCLSYKLDLQRAYSQIPIDPKDYYLLIARETWSTDFSWKGLPHPPKWFASASKWTRTIFLSPSPIFACKNYYKSLLYGQVALDIHWSSYNHY